MIAQDIQDQLADLTFSMALDALKMGAKVARDGWNGEDMWIKVMPSLSRGDMDLPYIFMKTALGDRVPWLASQTDLLAEDWYVL